MTKQRQEQIDAIENLKRFFPPGSTVYTILRHVSASGMTRHIGIVALESDDQAGRSLIDFHPNWLASKAIGARLNKRGDGLIVRGCGMDMGFHVAYTLARSLYPEGFECTGSGCNSNDHSNGDRSYTPHHHNDGGYALRHRWL